MEAPPTRLPRRPTLHIGQLLPRNRIADHVQDALETRPVIVAFAARIAIAPLDRRDQLTHLRPDPIRNPIRSPPRCHHTPPYDADSGRLRYPTPGPFISLAPPVPTRSRKAPAAVGSDNGSGQPPLRRGRPLTDETVPYTRGRSQR